MGRAYLTIDDGPTGITDRILDYLLGREITPILFFVGTQVELNYTQAIAAVKRGAIIGNHSYSHADFNKLTEAECIAEIERQEIILEKLYRDAGRKRINKLFRFPYGHRGGKIKLGYRSFYTIRNLIVLMIEILSINGIFSKGLIKRWMCFGHLILESIL